MNTESKNISKKPNDVAQAATSFEEIEQLINEKLEKGSFTVSFKSSRAYQDKCSLGKNIFPALDKWLKKKQ